MVFRSRFRATMKLVNEHDTTILPQTFSDVIAFSQRIGMDLSGVLLSPLILPLILRRIIS